jgi:phage terminase large subunit
VVDRLVGLHDDVYGINVADRSIDSNCFANLRAEGYWRLRERFERGPIMIPDDDELIHELTSLKYTIVNRNGQIRLAEKEEMKKRLGTSPDLADRLCLAFLAPPQGPDVVIESI